MMCQYYNLRDGDEDLVSIEIECPSWLPLQPRIPIPWLRYIIGLGLARLSCSVLKT